MLDAQVEPTILANDIAVDKGIKYHACLIIPPDIVNRNPYNSRDTLKI